MRGLENRRRTGVAFGISVELFFGFLFVAAAWRIGAELEATELQRLILDIIGFFSGLLITAVVRFELYREASAHRLEELDQRTAALPHLIKESTFLANFCEAMHDNNKTIRQVLEQELHKHRTLLSDAAEGRVKISSSQPHTIVNYSDFFKQIGENATIKATTVILPSVGFARIINDENKKLIAKRGGNVTRIFVLSRDSLAAWHDFMNGQHAAGVTVRALIREELTSDMLVEDVLIVDKPRMATLAETDIGSNTYKSVTLITNPDEVAKREETWDALYSASSPWLPAAATTTGNTPATSGNSLSRLVSGLFRSDAADVRPVTPAEP